MNYNQEKVKNALNKLNKVCKAAGCVKDNCLHTCYINVAKNSLKIIEKKTISKNSR